ncbi:hypothetical protein [Bacillus sp. FJAT-45037]|uniref:hypothetical protein n=1 Tax=Bacillus sp. FJAT-45037 TaxID=2011007 RepID=UPI000C23901B|nr:hypothetical protein [Bacillus sp. FJAT-45037]
MKNRFLLKRIVVCFMIFSFVISSFTPMTQAQTVDFDELQVKELSKREVRGLQNDINQLEDFRALISYLIKERELPGNSNANINAFVKEVTNAYGFSYDTEQGRSAELHLKGLDAAILFTENSSRSILGAMIEREVQGNTYVEAYDVINGVVYHTSTMEVFEGESRPENLRNESLHVIENNQGVIHYHDSPFIEQAKLTDSTGEGCTQEGEFTIQSCSICTNVCAWVVPSITCSIGSYAYCSWAIARVGGGPTGLVICGIIVALSCGGGFHFTCPVFCENYGYC